MPKTRGTTTERGLGWAHQQERRRLLPLAYHRPCPLCGETMWPEDRLDLNHVTPRCFGGSTSDGGGEIVHASCNRAEGPRIREELRRATGWRPPREKRSRQW